MIRVKMTYDNETRGVGGRAWGGACDERVGGGWGGGTTTGTRTGTGMRTTNGTKQLLQHKVTTVSTI